MKSILGTTKAPTSQTSTTTTSRPSTPTPTQRAQPTTVKPSTTVAPSNFGPGKSYAEIAGGGSRPSSPTQKPGSPLPTRSPIQQPIGKYKFKGFVFSPLQDLELL